MNYITYTTIDIDLQVLIYSLFFFFNDTATTEIYTLSLHDALPIYPPVTRVCYACGVEDIMIRTATPSPVGEMMNQDTDRKSTRLNSSHLGISYAVFCLKKKKNTNG